MRHVQNSETNELLRSTASTPHKPDKISSNKPP